MEDSSPSLPSIERVLDNTALAAFKRCRRLYYFAYWLHRRESVSSGALAYGSVIHKLLETHYKTGSPMLAELAARAWWEKNGPSEQSPDEYRTLDRALLDYRRYRDRWGQHPTDEQGRTLGWPDEPLVELSLESVAGGLIHPYAGKIDRIIELGGLYYIEDHKTTSRLDGNFYRALELSPQFQGYTHKAQFLLPSIRIVGVRVNVIHCLKTSTNFERQIIPFNREQLDEWEQDTNRWMEDLAEESARWQELYGSNPDRLPVEGQPWPRATLGDNGCSGKYGMCSYYPICSITPKFRAGRVRELPVLPWNPLEADD